VAESGAAKKSGPGPPLLLSPMDAAETVPAEGVQPDTVLPFVARRAEKGFTTCCTEQYRGAQAKESSKTHCSML